MDPIEKSDRARQAKRRLRAQRVRAGRLRGRVVAISLISFLLLWAAVFVQMGTGNDPVLGDSASSAFASQRGKPRAARVNLKTSVVEADPDTASDDADSEDTNSEGGRTTATAATEGSGLGRREATVIEPEQAAEAPAPVTTGQS